MTSIIKRALGLIIGLVLYLIMLVGGLFSIPYLVMGNFAKILYVFIVYGDDSKQMRDSEVSFLGLDRLYNVGARTMCYFEMHSYPDRYESAPEGTDHEDFIRTCMVCNYKRKH